MNLLFGYAPQVFMWCQLCTNSSSVSRFTAPTHFVPHGSNNDQWVDRFWNHTSVCRWLENSATCRSDKRSNTTNITIYFNRKFVQPGSPTLPKHDATLITFHCLLLGKVHWGMLYCTNMYFQFWVKYCLFKFLFVFNNPLEVRNKLERLCVCVRAYWHISKHSNPVSWNLSVSEIWKTRGSKNLMIMWTSVWKWHGSLYVEIVSIHVLLCRVLIFHCCRFVVRVTKSQANSCCYTNEGLWSCPFFHFSPALVFPRTPHITTHWQTKYT